MNRPALCRWCKQDLALIGLGSHYCEACKEALHPSKYVVEPDAREVARREALSGEWQGRELEASARYPQMRGDQLADGEEEEP